MVMQSWERVPSILQTVTGSFSTAAERKSVVEFHTNLKNLNTLAYLESTFAKIYVTVDKNIKWRGDNEERIVSWINSSSYNSSKMLSSNVLVLSILFLIQIIF